MFQSYIFRVSKISLVTWIWHLQYRVSSQLPHHHHLIVNVSWIINDHFAASLSLVLLLRMEWNVALKDSINIFRLIPNRRRFDLFANVTICWTDYFSWKTAFRSSKLIVIGFLKSLRSTAQRISHVNGTLAKIEVNFRNIWFYIYLLSSGPCLGHRERERWTTFMPQNNSPSLKSKIQRWESFMLWVGFSLEREKESKCEQIFWSIIF